MKKFSSIVLTILMISSIFTVAVSAKDISGWAGTINVNGDVRTYIRNEYYQLYHDTLFEQAYTIYRSEKNTLSKQKINDFFGSDTIGKIGKQLYKEMSASDDTYYLITYLTSADNFSESNNRELLSSLKGVDEILYIGTTTPCAIIVVTGKNIDKILECKNIEYVNYAFFIFTHYPTSRIPEDGNRTYKPDAAHARKVLRYSAGLYNFSDFDHLSQIKEFLIMSDANFDGKITAADARTALRIAAQIENGNEFYHITDSFWKNF